MLTQRQVRLLMLLASAEGWTTAAELSERLSVSSKLVKQEMAALRTQLGETAQIDSNPRRGYLLVRLDDTARAAFAEGFDAHAGHHSIRRRYAQVLLMLLMADGLLSMAEIAKRLYISKATVSEQVDTLRYRMGRLANLKLKVSRTQGLSIEASEEERRYEASKWIEHDRLDALGLEGEAAENFWAERLRWQRVLDGLLAKQLEAGRISGEDVRRLANWCALAGVRNRAGHTVDPGTMPSDEEPCALAQKILDCGGSKLGPQDSPALARLLYELLAPAVPTDLARAHAAQLMGEVQLATGALPLADPSEKRDRIAIRIEGIMRRTSADHNILNWHASETVARYPFESYMAVRYLDRMLPPHIPKAESMLLALGIAGMLERVRGGAPVVLYTNENIAVIGHIRAQLKAHWGERLRITEVRPLDSAQPAPTGAIELATDPSAVMRHPRAIVLPALPSDRDMAAVDRIMGTRRERTQRELSARLVKRASSRTDPIQAELPQDATVLTAYRTVCAVVEPEAGTPSSIEVSPLEPPAPYRGKRYRRLITAVWDRADTPAFDFFSVLSELLVEELKDAR